MYYNIMSLLIQCCTVADGSVRNTGLWIITHIHSNILQERGLYINTKMSNITYDIDLVPSDYNYLPDGSSLTILFTELELYCIHSRGNPTHISGVVTKGIYSLSYCYTSNCYTHRVIKSNNLITTYKMGHYSVSNDE